MMNNLMKRCLVSLIVMEIGIKITMRYHCMPSQIAEIRNSDSTEVGKEQRN